MISRKQLIIILAAMLPVLFLSNLNSIITDGERLTFNIKYGVISAAEATLSVNSSTLDDKPVWLIASNAKTYSFFDAMFKVRDTVQSWWEKDNLHSLRFSKRLNEGKYRQYRVHHYDQANHTSVYQRWNFKKGVFRTKTITIPANTQDILSAFYYTRQQELAPGKTVLIDVTTDGQSYKTAVVVHRRETIDSIFGKKRCLVIEPKLRGEAVFKQSGKILIWVTDDEYKVPLKMTSEITFGHFTALLKSAEKVPYPVVQN